MIGARGDEALAEYEAMLASQLNLGNISESGTTSRSRSRSPRKQTRSLPIPSKYLAGKQGQMALIKDLKHLRAAVEDATSMRSTSRPSGVRAKIGDVIHADSRVTLKRGESSTNYKV